MEEENTEIKTKRNNNISLVQCNKINLRYWYVSGFTSCFRMCCSVQCSISVSKINGNISIEFAASCETPP